MIPVLILDKTAIASGTICKRTSETRRIELRLTWPDMEKIEREKWMRERESFVLFANDFGKDKQVDGANPCGFLRDSLYADNNSANWTSKQYDIRM